MRIMLVFMLCWLMTSPAFAGAWLRAKGGWFSATSNTWNADGSFYNAFYAEYGLWDWMTVGIDTGIDSAGTVSTMFFSRVPVWQSENGHRVAFEVGGGHSAGRPVSKTGLSFGRGLSTRYGGGWLAIDLGAKIDLWTGADSYSIDTTVGIAPSEKWKTILQFQTEIAPDFRQTTKIAPSAVRRLGRRTQFEFGFSETLMGGQASSVKLGIWLEF